MEKKVDHENTYIDSVSPKIYVCNTFHAAFVIKMLSKQLELNARSQFCACSSSVLLQIGGVNLAVSVERICNGPLSCLILMESLS